MKVIIYSNDPEIVEAAQQYAREYARTEQTDVIGYNQFVTANPPWRVGPGENVIVFAHGVMSGGLTGEESGADGEPQPAFIGDAAKDGANANDLRMRTDATAFAEMLAPRLPAAGAGRILIQACQSAEINLENMVTDEKDRSRYQIPDSFAGELIRELGRQGGNVEGPAIDVVGRLGKPSVGSVVPALNSNAWRVRGLWLSEHANPDNENAEGAPNFPPELLNATKRALAEFLQSKLPEPPDSPRSSDTEESTSKSDTSDPTSRDEPHEEATSEQGPSGEQADPLNESHPEETDHPAEEALPGR